MGASGSGKTLAIRALSHECNAMLIDISPTTIESQLTDKKALEGIINSAFKVAKEF